MDEITKTQQDEVKTPEGDKEITPEKTPETLEEQVRHIKEAAFAEVGRFRVATERATKAAEIAKNAANAAEGRLTQFIKQQEGDELEAAGDDSEKQTLIRERQKRRIAETELAKKGQELDEERAKTTEAQEAEAKSTKEQNAREIATRLDVDAKTLIQFTDGSTEAMEELAKVLPKKGEAKTLIPDSGKTTGGGKIYKQDEMLSTLDPKTKTPQQIHEQVLEFEKAVQEGRVK